MRREGDSDGGDGSVGSGGDGGSGHNGNRSVESSGSGGSGDGDGRPGAGNGHSGSNACDFGQPAAGGGQAWQELDAHGRQRTAMGGSGKLTGAHEAVGAFRQAGRAAKANLLPAALLWAVAVAIIVAYYHHAPTQALFDRIASVKQHYGYAFSAVSTPIFAALLPLLIQRLARACGSRGVRPEPWRNLPLLLVFWAYRGAEIDGLYRLQTWLWGTEHTLWPLAGQVAIDQGGYVTLWAIPTMVFVFLFKDSGYSLSRTWRAVGHRWYRNRCVPVLVVNWVVWIPVVVVIYSLPPGLRIPVMNINVCLFMLLVMFLTHDTKHIKPAP